MSDSQVNPDQGRRYAIGICPECRRQQLQGDHDPYCYCLANEAGGWKATAFRLLPVALDEEGQP